VRIIFYFLSYDGVLWDVCSFFGKVFSSFQSAIGNRYLGQLKVVIHVLTCHENTWGSEGIVQLIIILITATCVS
jgi:hypothetical protein